MTRPRLLVAGLAVLAAVAFLGREWTAGASRPRPLVPAVSSIAAGASSARPVIFVGLDGGDWEALLPLTASGAMPNLARLVAEGTSGVLETIHPPLSPLVWTTMLTGVSPVEHGILDFTRFNPKTGEKEPITADERQAPAIWNMATQAGRRVAVFGLWATYPAESVNGLLVSDRLFSFLYKEATPPPGMVFPATEEARVKAALRKAEAAVDLAALQEYLPGLTAAEYAAARGQPGADPYAHPVTALERILVETSVYHDLATEVLRRERPDLAVVYFQGTDSIGHVFAPFAPPRQSSVSEADFARYGSAPRKYFERVDQMLGEYLRLAAERGAVLMLASDHGFLWGVGRPTGLSSFALATAGRWHRKQGLYLVWGQGLAAGGGRGPTASAAQVCSTLLALMGLPRGLGLAGPPLTGIEERSASTVDYREHYRPVSAASAVAGGADQEAIEKLKALGYIGAAESGRSSAGARGSTRTAGSYNNAGLVLRDQGHLDQARAAFEKAIEIDPGLGSALWNLSDLLFQQRTDLARSDALLVQAFAGDVPETRRHLVERGMAYQRAGETRRSLALMEAAIAARPDALEPRLFRGRYRVEVGDCAGALADFEAAIGMAPADAAAHASAGLARLCLGDPAGARRRLERSLELDPAQPRVREYLGRLRGEPR